MSRVLILVGSKSDMEYARKAADTLEGFGVEYQLEVSSAHRKPEYTKRLAGEAESSGFGVIIALAGYAAALPGFAASVSKLPVIGVPLPTSDLKGVDAALSIMQMPGGVPVASMGIGIAGAKNAALMAIRILSLQDPNLSDKLTEYIESQAKG
ncbi:MAG: 5-(carboxyamino)imidazole ribonucleotide mutase [candidate division Zixibacteria bacterium]|nr:5-(carboxyamino)imidazole ribonucleotide mutase [candidate division Zixibacteria bacterium]